MVLLAVPEAVLSQNEGRSRSAVQSILCFAPQCFKHSGASRTHTLCLCVALVKHQTVQDLPLQVPGTCRGTQTLLTINQPLIASGMVWLRLWTAAVCTSIPNLSLKFVQSMDNFFVPSVLPPTDCFDQLNTALF